MTVQWLSSTGYGVCMHVCVCACVGVEGVGCLCINTQKNTPLPNKISLHYVHFTFPVVFSERKFWPFFTSKTSCHSNTGQLLINPPHFAQQKSDGMPAHRLTDNVHTPGDVSYNFSTLVWQSKSQQWLKKWQPNNTQLVLSNKWKINIVRQLKIQPSEYFFFYTYIRLPSHEQNHEAKISHFNSENNSSSSGITGMQLTASQLA